MQLSALERRTYNRAHPQPRLSALLAIEHTTIECMGRDRAHTTYTQDPNFALGDRILDCTVGLWSS